MHISGKKSPLTQHKPSWVYVSVGHVSVKKSFSYLLTPPWRPSREPKQQQQQIGRAWLGRSLLDQCPALLTFTLGFIWEGAGPAATPAQHKGSVHLSLLTCECCIRNPDLRAVHSEALQNSVTYFCGSVLQMISLNDGCYPSLSAAHLHGSLELGIKTVLPCMPPSQNKEVFSPSLNVEFLFSFFA